MTTYIIVGEVHECQLFVIFIAKNAAKSVHARISDHTTPRRHCLECTSLAYMQMAILKPRKRFKPFTEFVLTSHLPIAPYGVRTSPHKHGILLRTAHCLGQNFSSHNLFLAETMSGEI